MDKGGIRIGHLDHGYLPHPTSMRKVIQDWSIRRADRLRGYIRPYRELGNELAKNYDYERILSTSRGSSGSSGKQGVGEALSSCGFGKGRRTGQNG
jgi:hypothetical protein